LKKKRDDGVMLSEEGPPENPQIYTPNFKRHFGDWEAAAAQRQLDEMTPIQAAIPASWKRMSLGELRAAAFNELTRLQSSGVVARHPRLKEIRFSSRGKKKSIARSPDPAKLLMTADLPKLIEGSIIVGSKPSTKSEREPNVRAYHTLVAKIRVGAVVVDTIFTIREDNKGNLYYNHGAFEPAQKTSPLASPRDTLSHGEERATSAYNGLTNFIRRPLDRVNLDSVSQVVNDDGTPKVVYHGGRADFHVFDTRGSSDDLSGTAWFTDSLDDASFHATGRGWVGVDKSGANIKPVYLNIRNPLIVTDGADRVGDTAWESTIIDQAYEEGRDGIIFKDSVNGLNTYVAFESTQIKAATGNRGTFDPNDPNILLSEDLEQHGEWTVKLGGSKYQAGTPTKMVGTIKPVGRGLVDVEGTYVENGRQYTYSARHRLSAIGFQSDAALAARGRELANRRREYNQRRKSFRRSGMIRGRNIYSVSDEGLAALAAAHEQYGAVWETSDLSEATYIRFAADNGVRQQIRYARHAPVYGASAIAEQIDDWSQLLPTIERLKKAPDRRFVPASEHALRRAADKKLSSHSGEAIRVESAERERQRAIRDAGDVLLSEDVDSDTALLDAIRSLRDPQGSDQTRQLAKDFVGNELTNTETGIVATVSVTSLGEMLNKIAMARSVSPLAHLRAVANIDKLFAVAAHRESRPGRKENDPAKTIHHFDVPMPFEDRVLRVSMMAKEFVERNDGTRIYLVEALEIGEPASLQVAPPKRSPTRPASPPTDSFRRKLEVVKSALGHAPDVLLSEAARDPDLIAAAVDLVVDYVASGGRKFREFIQKKDALVGRDVVLALDEFLREAWDRVRQRFPQIDESMAIQDVLADTGEDKDNHFCPSKTFSSISSGIPSSVGWRSARFCGWTRCRSSNGFASHHREADSPCSPHPASRIPLSRLPCFEPLISAAACGPPC
jgi:hypothetical protein